MSMPESLEALRRANPRARAGFAESVEAAAGAVHNEIAAPTTPLHPAPDASPNRGPLRGGCGACGCRRGRRVRHGRLVRRPECIRRIREGRSRDRRLCRALGHGSRSDHARPRGLGGENDSLA